MGFSTRLGPSSVRNTPPRSQVGALQGYAPGGIFDGKWSGAPVAQVTTVTVDSATNDTTYTLTFTLPGDGEASVSYTSDASATTTEIHAGLKAACIASAEVSAWIDTTGADPDIVLTSRNAGTDYEFSVALSSGDLSQAATTAASDGATLALGRAVAYDADGVSADANDGTIPIVTLDGELGVSSFSNAVTFAAGAVYTWTATNQLTGDVYGGEVAADTNSDDTAAALVTNINNTMPANTIIAAGAATPYTVTGEVAGVPWSFQVAVTDTGAAAHTVTDNSPDNDDVRNVLAGVSLLDARALSPTLGGDSVYDDNATVPCLRKGKVDVAMSSAPTDNIVYLGTGSSNAGQWFGAGAAARLALPKTIASVHRYDSSLGLATLLIDFSAI